MALSKEAKIGLLAVISLVIFFVGFYFLKGANLFSSDQEYYCYYNSVEGLQNSANVQIKGLNVGHVAAMHLEPGKGVRVTVSISKDIQLPLGTIASLESFDLLGTKMIRLDIGSGPGILPKGAQLLTAREGGIVDNVSAELTPRLRELKNTISNFDTTLSSVNAVVNAENQLEIAAALKSIRITASNLAELSESLKKESGEISTILHNANSFSANLVKNNDTLNRILGNVSSVTRQMSNAPIQKTVEDIRATVAELKAVADKINSNQGTLGLLINNKDLYNNLNSSMKSLDSLEKDIKAHPGRYINVTIFGKAKQ